MDFAKFVAILEERALFFARADNLGDKFEGARGITAREEEWRNYCLEWFRNSIITLPRGQESPLPPPEEIEHAAKKLLNDFTALGERELKSTYVNCWHANTGESEAQWRLYAPPLTSGVAIRTTFGKLDRALSSAFDIRAGYVQYIDFSKHFAGTYDRIFWKRSSLAHESEVRLVISDNPTTPAALPGIAVPIDVTSAFHSVVISPFAPSWLQGVVEATIRRFGFQLPVTPSTLLDEPFF